MNKFHFFSREKAVNFSIQLAEAKLENTNRRIKSYTNKTNFYFILLTILLSCVAYIIKPISAKDFIIDSISTPCLINTLKVILVAIVYILMLILYLYGFLAIIKLLKALEPITFMQHDGEAVDVSLTSGHLNGKIIYLSDLLKSAKYNNNTIDNQFTLLNEVNFYFKKIVYIIIAISFLLIVLQVLDIL